MIKYIINQEEHHRKKTFREEYIDFLNKYEIEFDEKYLFDWMVVEPVETLNNQAAPMELKTFFSIQFYKQKAPMELI